MGFQGRFQLVPGSLAGTSFLSPACELWDRENDGLFRILYHTCKNVAHGLLQQRRPVDGGGARGNGQEAFDFLRNRYEGRSEARVRNLLAEMAELHPAAWRGSRRLFRKYRLRLQIHQVGCTVDDYQLKAHALSGLSADIIPMLNQLRTMHSLDFTMVNEMLRELHVNDILPKKLRILYEDIEEDSMATVTTAKCSGKNRDISEGVCDSYKIKGNYAYISPAKKPLPQRSGAPSTRRDHIQTMSAWLRRQPLSQLPMFLHCQRLSLLPQIPFHLPWL